MASPMLAEVRRTARRIATARRARANAWFFKTGPGEYGEGDRFLGLSVPNIRSLARQFNRLAEADLLRLLKSPWHEERLLALVMLVHRAERSDRVERSRLCAVYLRHSRYVNNWDLVNSSARQIVGPLLPPTGVPAFLKRLARSRVIWDRRIALLATFHLIGQRQYVPSLALARLLLDDRHDLMHKALGWMLREIWKRDPRVAERFLRAHLHRLSRTALRYAIERMPERRRLTYLRRTT